MRNHAKRSSGDYFVSALLLSLLSSEDGDVSLTGGRVGGVGRQTLMLSRKQYHFGDDALTHVNGS